MKAMKRRCGVGHHSTRATRAEIIGGTKATDARLQSIAEAIGGDLTTLVRAVWTPSYAPRNPAVRLPNDTAPIYDKDREKFCMVARRRFPPRWWTTSRTSSAATAASKRA